MSDESAKKPSPVEIAKINSNYLRGTINQELADGNDAFTKANVQLLKHHGTYQQDDREARTAREGGGKSVKQYMFMVRSRIPGGRLTSDQLLAEIDLGDECGNSTLRITSRQGLQLHGIVKRNLHQVIQRINEVQLSTLAACGDVERNIMCCPAPHYNDPVHEEMHGLAVELLRHIAPKSRAYHEIWLRDPDTGQDHLVAGGANGNAPHEGGGGATNGHAQNGHAACEHAAHRPDAGGAESDWSFAHGYAPHRPSAKGDLPDPVEPLYGPTYLPRKFKTAIGLAGDNCIDIYANDLGLMAVCENFRIVGYNVLVGGGMGVVPSAAKTFPGGGQTVGVRPARSSRRSRQVSDSGAARFRRSNRSQDGPAQISDPPLGLGAVQVQGGGILRREAARAASRRRARLRRPSRLARAGRRPLVLRPECRKRPHPRHGSNAA